MTGRRIGTALAALGVSLGLASCSVIPVAPEDLPATWIPSATPSPIPSDQANSPLGYSARKEAAVRIRNIGCDSLSTGSGFILDEHTIVTNHHVVASTGRLEVDLSDGTGVTVTGSVYATNADLGLIYTQEALTPTVRLADTDPHSGDSISVEGYPLGDGLTSTFGTVEDSGPDQIDKASTVYFTSAAVEHGSSGSAVYGASGTVVGVVYAGNDRTKESIVVPVSLLREFLADPSLQVNNEAACSLG